MKMIHLLCLLMVMEIISCEDKGFVRWVVRVGEDVVLPCSLGPEVDIESALFDWTKGQQDVFLYNAGFYHSGDLQFRGRVSHFPDKLKNGNASIIIRNIQLSDSGNYSCYFPRPQEQRFHVELVVGICAKPRVMILGITEHWVLLQCEVRGAFPKPQISWIDSDKTVLPAKEKLEDTDGLRYPPALMLQTNVTKTGIFHCRVTQQELNHTTEAQISTHICSDETVKGSDGGRPGVAIVCWILFALCLVVAGIYWCRRGAMRVRPNAINSRKDKRPVMAERRDSGVSSLHSSYHPERLNTINSPKDKRPAMEKSEKVRVLLHLLDLPEGHDSPDSGISFSNSSYYSANSEETREPKPEPEPDEAVRIPLEEF